MPKRKCVFNPRLKLDFPFLRDGDKIGKVFCTLCKSLFTIQNGGRSDIRQHLNQKKHLLAVSSSSTTEIVGIKDQCELQKNGITSMFKKLINTSDEICKTATVIMVPTSSDSIELEEKSITSEQLDNQKCTISFTQEPLESFKKLLLPVGWMLYCDGNVMSIYKPIKTIFGDMRLVIEKQIVFEYSSLDVSYYVNHNRLDPEVLGLKHLTYPLNKILVTDTIQLFEHIRICEGGPSIDKFPGIHVKNTHIDDKIWRHDECSIVSYSKKRCKQCNPLLHCFDMCKKRLTLKNQI